MGSETPRTGSDAGVARRLLTQLGRHPALLAGGALAVLAAAAGQLALTWRIKLWSDRLLLPGAGAGALGAELAVVGAILAALLVAVFLSRSLLAALEQRLQQELRDAAQAALLEAELSTVERSALGEWQSRLWNDGALLSGFVPDLLRRGVGGIAVAAGAFAMMLWLDWRLALALIVALPPVALAFAAIGRRIRRSSRAAQEELAEATSLAAEQLRGLATIRAYGTAAAERRRFAAAGELARRHALRSELWATALVTAVWLVTAVGLVAAVAYGSGRVAAGERTPGDLLAFALFAAQGIEPLRRLSDFQGRWQRTLAAAERLFAVIDLPPEERAPDAPPIARAPARSAGARLLFDSVRFAYRDEAPVLDGASFTLAAGENVALVAASGGGKSTVARLLLGFERPGSGRIEIDGRDLAGMSRRELRREVGVVFQEPLLFRGTLAENLAYGAGEVSRARLLEVAEQVALGPLLAALPRGLESELVEAGRSLSGGERQRIALARAVLRAPRLLLLDEATSAVDSENEERILDRLATFLAGRTVLVMAHRLALVRRSPRALLLERGRIAGDGAPGDLLRDSAAFRELFAAQSAAARGDS